MIKENEKIFVASPPKFNFENKSLDELKQIRKNFNLKEIRHEHYAEAYVVRMLDILLDKIERLENDHQ